MPLHYPEQLPLLLLPNDENGRSQLAFSLSDNKMLQLKLSKAHRPWFRGSPSGWLLTLLDNPRFILWNPFTKAEIELPPLTSIPNVLSFDESRVGREYTVLSVRINELYKDGKVGMRDSILKAALSSHPTSDLDYTVIVIDGTSKQLALCKHGDKKWNTVEEDFSFEEINYYDKQFYAVDIL